MRLLGGDALVALEGSFPGVRSALRRTSYIIATKRMRWRLLHSPPMDGPDNMAFDVALMARARRTGDTVLRIYSWSTPTLSLGRNQRAVGEYDLAALASEGLGVVRRPTGGRALLHDREITYSVTAPVCDTLGTAYGRINDLLVAALTAVGVPGVTVEATGGTMPPAGIPCFAEPSGGELSVAGRKLVGSAQWRDNGVMLQHGSVLIDDDQARIGGVMAGTMPPLPPAATLRELLGRAPSPRELGECLMQAVHARADASAEWFVAEEVVLADARRLRAGFVDDAWTWRR